MFRRSTVVAHEQQLLLILVIGYTLEFEMLFRFSPRKMVLCEERETGKQAGVLGEYRSGMVEMLAVRDPLRSPRRLCIPEKKCSNSTGESSG